MVKLATEFTSGHGSNFGIDVTSIENDFDEITAYTGNLCPCGNGVMCPCPPALVIVDEEVSNSDNTYTFIGPEGSLTPIIETKRKYKTYTVNLSADREKLANKDSDNFTLVITKEGYPPVQITMKSICQERVF